MALMEKMQNKVVRDAKVAVVPESIPTAASAGVSKKKKKPKKKGG